MKNGTEYAKRVRRVYAKFRARAGRHPETELTDPTEQLVVGLLGWEATPANVAKAFHKLNEQMVDLNEVRVAAVRETSTLIREYVPNAMECARSISRCLNDVFRRQHRMSLDCLREMGRREARQYLESLDGVHPHALASVLLCSLGAHAIPVNYRFLTALRREGLVDPEAGPAVVQAFLERNIAAAQARDFYYAMEKFAVQKGVRAVVNRDEPRKTKTRRRGTKGASHKGDSASARRRKKAAGA